jgi:hypothetical protein
MKKTALIISISLLFSSVAVESALVNLAEANPIYQPGYLTIAIIDSPENATYGTNIIPLEIETGDHQVESTGYYRVDGGPFIKINEISGHTATFRGELNLTDGPHSVFVKTVTVGSACAVVYFTVEIPPLIAVLSPENKTYDTSNVMLNFTLNKEVTTITYCLDRLQNVTITGNTTLPKLSNGPHNIVIYAWKTWTDSQETVGASETVYFTISEAEPFPTGPAISAIALAAVIGVGLLLYLKKCKH